MKVNLQLLNFFKFWIKIFTYATKTIIQKNESFSTLKPLILKISNEFTRIVSSLIPKIPDFESFAFDQQLLSVLLTSHFKTQMTTVIESTTKQESIRYAQFLSHFILPYQLELSSLDYSPNVTTGLYLQCVKRQNGHPADYMMQFPRPVTWLRLPERQIFCTNSESGTFDVKSKADFILANILENKDPEVKKTISRFKAIHRVEEVTIPAPWVVAVVATIIQTPKISRNLVCEQFLGNLIRMAVVLVAYVKEKMITNNTLSKEHTNEIQKMLKLVGSEDFSLVIAVANLFDEDIFKKFKRN
ncbi:hypothetical protein GPJ56_004587 [Histomonas meleagridis]|uniref:uncharacterized protein n=1 Tax=Histomonas meleagridis TaxID=135588 RepID=UPI0035595D96|nr:hypothetical protein GPJ56_004587 [Histomonas meleagridis]KAH0800549.1 hypothetical protein GO595_006617 [Histomonas meleagridis]